MLMRGYNGEAEQLPPDSWIRWLGGLIKCILAVFMAITLLGLGLGVYGLRQWLRIRRIERTLATGDEQTDA